MCVFLRQIWLHYYNTDVFFFLCDIENKTKMCDWEIMRKTEAQEGAGGRYYRVASRSTQKQEPFFVMLSLPSFHSCSPLSK